MLQMPIVYSEEQRLRAVRQLQLLDTASEPEFDDFVQLAAIVCGAPVSLVSLIDEHRLWFKAATGIERGSIGRELSFCDHAIRQSGLLLVEDAGLDPRFRNHPAVTDHGFRFYAGLPITDPHGIPVGTLCVLDNTPRTLSESQCQALCTLASQVNARLELRSKRQELEHALARAEAATARLEASEQRFQIFMDSGPFLAYFKDQEGRMLYYNEKVARQFDVSRTFLLGKTDAELWPADLARVYREHDLEALHSGGVVVVDEHTANPDHSTSTWRSYKFHCTDADGRPLLGGVSLDVTAELRREAELQRSRAELEEANRRLRQLACVDPLTGLANRRVLDDELKNAFRGARQTGSALSLLILDVDNFKTHNDRFGHSHGDDVLRNLGICLRSQLRKGELIARFGGEEFVVVLENTPEADALSVANRLHATIGAYPWSPAPVTVSIGVSTLSAATPDAGRLLTLADEALYVAKSSGRNRVVSYSSVYAETLRSAQATVL